MHDSYPRAIVGFRKGVVSSGTTPSSRASGEIAYHYSYLQFGRAVTKGVLSTGTTRSSGATDENVSHYRHSDLKRVKTTCKTLTSCRTGKSASHCEKVEVNSTITI